MALGAGICKFAFMGAVSRYVADEVAPVGKDVINYMAEGTQGAVREVAAAVAEGLHAGTPAQVVHLVRCHKCNHSNNADAKFCSECGAALAKSVPCLSCHELNDPDAKFCDNCGKPLG